jgi:NAD(P)-dependent dehydrogenase (short-subunit alcohol dehydrogenase family)
MAEGKVAVCTGSGRPGGLGEAILNRLGKEGYRDQRILLDTDWQS